MEPNKRQLKKWIAALDSGEYEQWKGEMQRNGKYCCLGVGCKIMIPGNKQKVDNMKRLVGCSPISQPFAPQWLKDINGDFCLKTGRSLIALNDWEGYTFSEIATLLELVYIHKILD